MIKLDEILKAKGITQTAFANDLGLTQPMINRYANNKSEPSTDTICKIADYLHITTDELLGRDTNLLNLASLNDKTHTTIQTILNLNDNQLDLVLQFIKALRHNE